MNFQGIQCRAEHGYEKNFEIFTYETPPTQASGDKTQFSASIILIKHESNGIRRTDCTDKQKALFSFLHE